jgi:hypothetical protein
MKKASGSGTNTPVAGQSSPDTWSATSMIAVDFGMPVALVSSHTVTRGRRKGGTILTIVGMLDLRLTRISDEIEWVQ